VCVTDGGAAHGQKQANDREPNEHGRGIALIAALACARGSDTRRQGACWWAHLSVAGY
jgi:hypothetical protein